jgi:hypothetical protein
MDHSIEGTVIWNFLKILKADYKLMNFTLQDVYWNNSIMSLK